MPNNGSAAVDAHLVPSRNLKKLILWMAGTPEMTMYTVISTTQPTASIPHKKKMKFITASSHSAGVRGIRTRFSREEDFLFIFRSFEKAAPTQPFRAGRRGGVGFG